MFRRVSVAACAVLVLCVGQASAGLINNELNQTWASFRDLSSAEFSAKFSEYSAAGYRMIDVDAYPNGSGVLYSQVWEKNSDSRAWSEYRDMTAEQYGTRFTTMSAQGYRLQDLESYRIGSSQRYAAIWVKNTESFGWSSRRDMTALQYGTYFNEQKAAGRRPVDIEIYPTSSGLRYAAVWYQNVGSVAWVQLRDLTLASYQQQYDQQKAAGYRLIDFESYQSGSAQRYAAIWEKNPVGRGWMAAFDRTELQFANLWRLYEDQGYRLVDFERYNISGGVRYAGIWVENDSRFDYARKGTLDSIISKYQGPTENHLPGISVAVIRNGVMIYRRGFGYADKSAGKFAYGETVYNAASIAKVIGATLAAKLEAEDRLHDGATFDLDLSRRTSFYLGVKLTPFSTAMPKFHTHTVEQLLSHLGCVAHYDTTPAIPDQTTHRATAMEGVRSIWNTGLVKRCTIGATVSYSTPAFTFVGAVLEKVTGRPVPRLLREELAQPFGLSTLRLQFESPTLPPNYDRATPYSDEDTATSYSDSSWKMLSGGMEISAVDLARFGWKVLNGEIVSSTVRDNRLWAAVNPNCGSLTSGTCQYGIGWRRGFVGSNRVVEHDGIWPGARSFIRVYRDKGLVIAVMSNRRNHEFGDVGGLTTQIGNAVLGKVILKK